VKRDTPQDVVYEDFEMNDVPIGIQDLAKNVCPER
tara:strand:- start:470 stop:574 length:105 start_codon:yes stop_codon:yes gene_type:complete